MVKQMTTNFSKQLYLLFVTLFVFSYSALAQLFPIQVNTQITPPYSVYLADYTIPGVEKLAVNILLSDPSRQNYPVKLKLVIEGSGIKITTSPTYFQQQILLDGGSPLRLTGDELAGYFNADNLDFVGYSKDKFKQSGALPEGIYRIGFQVLDYNKSIPVSLTGSATAWLILNDPPIINTPKNSVVLTATDPQNIMFQWMPRHMGSPNSAFTVEYALQIFEIWPQGINPNVVVSSTQPLTEIITSSTSYVYTNNVQPDLVPGRQYAFRVQARDTEERDLFRNHGYSEVQMFTYGQACLPPSDVTANATSTKITISWSTSVGNTLTKLQYRIANSPNATWYPKSTTESSITILNLTPNTKYEYQVMAQCGTVNSENSPIYSITTAAQKPTNFACGTVDQAVAITSTTPLATLKKGDIITTGKFETSVISATGTNGKFGGEGYTNVPFLGIGIHTKFTDITVNNKYQVTAGEIVSIYNQKSDYLLNVGGNTQSVAVNTAADSKEVVLSSTISTIVKQPNGDLIITSTNGEKTTVHFNADGTTTVTDAKGAQKVIPAGSPILIADASGYTSTIDKNGNVTSKTATSTTSSTSALAVTFSPATTQQYGFDAYDPKYPALDNSQFYKTETINGQKYYIPWKSVKTGGSDDVALTLVPANKDAVPKITVANEAGVAQTLTGGAANSLTNNLRFTGSNSDGTEEFTVKYKASPTDKKDILAGRLNVVSYDEKAINVVLVSVNGNKLKGTDVQSLSAALKSIYKQACVTVNVSEGTPINYPYTTFDAKPTGAKSFSNDMKALIDMAEKSSGYNKNNYYLFLLNKCSEPTKKGIMPFDRNFGFIFTDVQSGNELNRTIAHELGHGAFCLRHTFSSENDAVLSQGQTDNLMDYAAPTALKLNKYQWDETREFHLGINWFEDEGEWESITTDIVLGYVISNAKAYARNNTSPYSIKTPNEILSKGKEIEIVNHLQKDKIVTIKYLSENTEYVISFSNTSKIQELKSKEKYILLSDQESIELPYSDIKTGNTSTKNSYVFADKICGDYYQIKENTTSNKGWWLPKSSLKRVDYDVANNFDWMKAVTVGTADVDKETLTKIQENRNGINDRTNADIYGSNRLRAIGSGHMNLGQDKGTPEFKGNDFEKKLKELIYDELKKEGTYSSINTYDDEIFTWGKGFSVKGMLMDVLDELLKTNGKDYEKIFGNVGIKIVDKHFWVVDKDGKWLKDLPPTYDASKYIKSNTELLSFFIELAEKSDYYQDVINAQYNKGIASGAGSYPSYILNDSKSGYSDNWNNTSVTVLCHLSFWSGYGWHAGTERYKDTKGELDKILYKYLYNTIKNYPATRKGEVIESGIYRWNISYNVIERLKQFGNPESAGYTKLEENWSANKDIELEFKKDKLSKLRAVKKDETKYISNTECIIIPEDGKFIIITINAEVLTYETYEK